MCANGTLYINWVELLPIAQNNNIIPSSLIQICVILSGVFREEIFGRPLVELGKRAENTLILEQFWLLDNDKFVQIIRNWTKFVTKYFVDADTFTVIPCAELDGYRSAFSAAVTIDRTDFRADQLANCFQERSTTISYLVQPRQIFHIFWVFGEFDQYHGRDADLLHVSMDVNCIDHLGGGREGGEHNSESAVQ